MKLQEVFNPKAMLGSVDPKSVHGVRTMLSMLGLSSNEFKIDGETLEVTILTNLRLRQKNLGEVPVKIVEVKGYADYAVNKIQSLECLPKRVGLSLTLHNNNFPNYHGIHKQVQSVGKEIIVDRKPNMLGLCAIKDLKMITVLDESVLSSILTKNIGDPLQAQEDLIEAGFKEEARF